MVDCLVCGGVLDGEDFGGGVDGKGLAVYEEGDDLAALGVLRERHVGRWG